MSMFQVMRVKLGNAVIDERVSVLQVVADCHVLVSLSYE